MTFYVKRTLESGQIRFSVDPRRIASTPRALFSTGRRGEFLRQSAPDLYFSEDRPQNQPEFVQDSRPAITAKKKWGQLAIMGAGVALVLLGIAVTMLKGMQGLIEIILGLALIAGPPIVTAKKRREERMRLEKERKEREEREAREREMVRSFLSALERLRYGVDDISLDHIRRVRSEAEIPYELSAPLARRVAAEIGFAALGDHERTGARGVAAQMDRVSEAAGLQPDDARAARLLVFQKLVWHLLADGAVSEAQYGELHRFREAFGLRDEDVDKEMIAVDAFARLSAPLEPVVARSLPAGEVAYHRSDCVSIPAEQPSARLWRRALASRNEPEPAHGEVIVTGTGVVIDAQTKRGVTYHEIADVEADVDDGTVTLVMRDAVPSERLAVADPVLTGGAIARAALGT